MNMRYDTVARALHWAMAALILLALALGMLHDALKPMNVMPLHKSLGLSVLVLAVVRIVWRMTHAAPPLPASLPPVQRALTAMVHGLLYLLMLAMPMSGWATASAGKYPLSYFGLLAVPKLAMSKPMGAIAHQAHGVQGWLMLALLAGHIGAAIWHRGRRDGIMERML